MPIGDATHSRVIWPWQGSSRNTSAMLPWRPDAGASITHDVGRQFVAQSKTVDPPIVSAAQNR